MARMIPDRIPGHAPHSEETVFECLKNSLRTREWVVFHSVYVKNPRNRARPYEIDFLILIPEYSAIVCLEAKGGSYEIKGGKWHIAPAGKPIVPSPPEQARQAMFAFEKEYETSYFKAGSLLSLGCAVAFTDAAFPQGASRPKQALIIENPDPRNPDRLGRILANHADKMRLSEVKRKLASKGADWKQASHAMKDLELELMKPKMITTASDKIFRQHLETLGEQLLRLTESQYNCLEQIQSSDNPPCVVDGAAGTGKTVIAMELARRLCDEGKNVAMLCSNPYLSSRFQRWTTTLPSHHGGSVVAGTPATLPQQVLSENPTLRDKYQERLDASPELKESLKPGYLNNEWRAFINETIQDLSKGEVSFDYLIVDEAQNLCDDVFLDLMDALLKDGLKEGRWTMFGDFTYQNIVLPQLNKDRKKTIDFLKRRGLTLFTRELKINCRNTYEIAAAFAMFADIVSPPISGVHGPIVQRKFFKYENEEDELDELDELLTRLVNDLQERDFFSRQIILLANDNDDLGKATKIAGWKLQNIRDATADKPLDSERAVHVSGESSKKKLRCSDIYDFQGLESDVVILVMPLTEGQSVLGGDATMPDYEHLRRVLYTGMSRAKAMLIIVAHKSYKEFLKFDSEHGRSYEDHIELLQDECNRPT